MGASQLEGDQLHIVGAGELSPARLAAGRVILLVASLALAAVLLVQVLDKSGAVTLGLPTWRPLLYAFVLWAIVLCVAQAMIRGEMGLRALFVLPGVLFTVATVVFPMLFGVYIAFTDWNLSAFAGRRFNGLDNFRQMMADPFYWNALRNMIWYVLAVLLEYAIAFGLALLLHAQIRARKFFRVVFLMPLMLSPVAVSWMIGKSLMENRFGPAATLARQLGWENPAFFTSPEIARLSIMVMDAWTFIPLMMVMLLAGLQALPKEIMEAAEVDGANAWQRFWKVVFPLMMSVSITAIVIRVIFKLKLADIIINVTAGGPGGATDSVTSFIFREYRDRSNVGYGTLLAMVYLILIIVFVTALLRLANRWMRRVT
jgi:multiple sugar transport system permease protein